MSFFCKSSDLVTAVDTKSFCLCKFMKLTLSQAPYYWLASYQWACAPTAAHLLWHTALHSPLSLRLNQPILAARPPEEGKGREAVSRSNSINHEVRCEPGGMNQCFATFAEKSVEKYNWKRGVGC